MPVESGIATSLVITLVLHSDHRSSIGLANVRAKSKARVASQARIPTADCATAEWEPYLKNSPTRGETPSALRSTHKRRWGNAVWRLHARFFSLRDRIRHEDIVTSARAKMSSDGSRCHRNQETSMKRPCKDCKNGSQKLQNMGNQTSLSLERWTSTSEDSRHWIRHGTWSWYKKKKKKKEKFFSFCSRIELDKLDKLGLGNSIQVAMLECISFLHASSRAWMIAQYSFAVTIEFGLSVW